jgi:hypothetical protein
MINDSRLYKALAECHSIPFDWKTNNCGLFVANVFSKLYDIDIAEGLRGQYDDEASAFEFIKSLGGWDVILTNRGFVKRQKGRIYPGDVVISENALGIYDGYRGLFAGGAFRERNKITDAYTYLEK